MPLFTITNKIEYTLNKPIFNTQSRTIHMFFSNLKIGYDTAQTCAHVCKVSHYIECKKVCCKAKWETIYKYLVLIKLPTKSLVSGPVTPTLQHNVDSSWHALIKRHIIMFNEIGINWTHTLPQFWDTSWRYHKFVQVLFHKCPEVFNGTLILEIVHVIEGVEMIVMQPFVHDLACVLGINSMLKDQPTWIQIMYLFSEPQEIF